MTASASSGRIGAGFVQAGFNREYCACTLAVCEPSSAMAASAPAFASLSDPDRRRHPHRLQALGIADHAGQQFGAALGDLGEGQRGGDQLCRILAGQPGIDPRRHLGHHDARLRDKTRLHAGGFLAGGGVGVFSAQRRL